MLANLILYILISLGVSYMWSFSEIFRPLRNIAARVPIIKYPLICPECSSFWFGLLTYLLIYSPFVIQNIFVSALLGGLIVHLCACILYKKVLI